jgi:hypothetical protein
MHLEPLPQTRFALAELSRYEEDEYRDLFGKVVTNVGIVAPDCVGLTVSFVRDGLAFTWLASSVDVAALDAVQYLASGPCLEAMEHARVVATTPSDDPLDERRWALFSQSENRVGVRSTLSIPLVTAGAGSMETAKVYGGVNLYGGAVTAFEGLHETLAAICGGWAQGAVTNSDLSLSGVRRAKHAPQMMLDQFAVDQAVGMIMAAQHLNSDAAGRKLREASDRAGIHEAELARLVVKTRLL